LVTLTARTVLRKHFDKPWIQVGVAVVMLCGDAANLGITIAFSRVVTHVGSQMMPGSSALSSMTADTTTYNDIVSTRGFLWANGGASIAAFVIKLIGARRLLDWVTSRLPRCLHPWVRVPCLVARL
jgi:hypothetical protein